VEVLYVETCLEARLYKSMEARLYKSLEARLYKSLEARLCKMHGGTSVQNAWRHVRLKCMETGLCRRMVRHVAGN